MKRLAVNPFRVNLFQMIMRLANALQKIPARTTPPPFRLMQIGSLFWQSRALYVAVKLGVADTIGDSSKGTREIAEALQLHEDHLYRLLRLLGSLGIFTEIAPRMFRNNETSAYLRRDNPQNVRAMILMHNSPQMTRPWMESLEESLRDGQVPFARVHGVDLFDYMDQNRDFDLLFSQAMDAVEQITGTEFLEDFNWDAFERIIDVGGSKGAKAISILKSHPGVRALVYDRPQIIEVAKSESMATGAEELLARLEFLGGDMFHNVPESLSDGDLYLCMAIFHGLSDEESTIVLGNLRTAMGAKKAHLLIVDAVAEEMNINPAVAQFDMQMLIGTRGRERTLSEWQRLLQGSGFGISEVVAARTFAKFIVAKVAQ